MKRWALGAATAIAAAAIVAIELSSADPVLAIPNPPTADACGVDVTLVLDASGSIQSSSAVGQVRSAAQAFLDALKDTSSTARVTQFGTVSAELAPSTTVDSTSLGSGGALTQALAGYYNPIPPRPNGVTFHQYRGSGSPQNPGSFTSGSSTQFTNWDAALDQAGDAPADLVVFVTDGDPTAYDMNQPGDPFNPLPPDVAYNTNRGQADATTLDRAVQEADAVKATGTRILTVGVGSALTNQASINRMIAVSGPQVVRDADLAGIDSLNDVDVALVTDFDDLAAFLNSVVLQLCSPSLTIRKFAQSSADASYQPAPGWAITAQPTTTSGQFDWILPDTTPAVSKTLATDGLGFAQFQWEPIPSNQSSQAAVTETTQPGFTAGRPGLPDFRCELRDDESNVRVVQGELTVNGTQAGFSLPQIGAEIVTCSLWNSFNYAPAIAVSKVNAPTSVRGDLTPPAPVTSNYAVSNPGNTPLAPIHVTDDKCASVAPVPPSGPNIGDVNADGRLDTNETWQYTCTRSTVVSRAFNLTTTVVNTVTAVGTAPNGTSVTASAADDVAVWVPAIQLVKLVDGAASTTITLGSTVTYTYAATNVGNTPLGSVTLTDDTAPCTAPTPDPGNTASPLMPGQSWNYSCSASPTDNVTNTATVSATPLDPSNVNSPFPNPNPAVTATDRADVEVVNPTINLVKSVSADVVLIGPPPVTAEPVVYTFVASNAGTPALNRPGATTQGPARDPGWIVDPLCTSPAVYTTGDSNDNSLLDPGESWAFSCPGAVTQPTLNTATITASPANPDGSPIGVADVSDTDNAFVDVVSPAISIEKLALVPVVLDRDSTPVAGPDAPAIRPARYVYEVTNTGNVELSLNPPTPVDNRCSPLIFEGGDSDVDGLIDPDETWNYRCVTLLDRQTQSTPPPIGNESGLVINQVTVSGIPFFGNALHPTKSVSAGDTAQVLVIDPGITITKSPSTPTVLAGGDVTYTFAVSNVGDVGLDVVSPTDDKCAPLAFVDGDANGNGLLDGANTAAPETWFYECTRSVGIPEAPAVADDNSVTVIGIDPLGNSFAASDTASVGVIDPAIALSKRVSSELVPAGSNVVYTFEVSNAGRSPVEADDVLADVTLSDAAIPAAPGCASPTFVGGDGNGDQLLQRDPPEVWIYTCSAAIPSSSRNVAVVRATGGSQLTPPLLVDVADVAFASVQVFHPALAITKTPSTTLLAGPGPVTYTYAVTNTGDVPLADVVDRISDDRCSPLLFVGGDDDGDGLLDTPNSIFEDSADETWTFTCTATIVTTTTNIVVVTGTPTDDAGTPLCGDLQSGARVAGDCDLNASATATVEVNTILPPVQPGTVTITKRTTSPTSQRFRFTYGTTTFTLGADESRTISNVPPGTYAVTESATSGWTLISLTCVDPTGNTVSSITDRRATIVVAPGETVQCTFTNRIATMPPTGGDSRTLGSLAAVLAAIGFALWLAPKRRRPV